MKKLKNISILIILCFLVNACGGKLPKLPGADARKVPVNPDERVRKNIEEGRGFRLMDSLNKNKKSGEFDFASSNALWRASLDVIDFIPLTSANYSGGIIITDWYSDNKNANESIKVTIRFLTNEVRSDSLDLKIFYKKCSITNNCEITEKSGNLVNELKKEILKKAAIYQKQTKDKNFKPYTGTFDSTKN
jgi:hypothetical protein